MSMTRRTSLALLVAPALGAQARELHGGWSATNGRYAFAGVWTASVQGEADTGGGTWGLLNSSGDIVLNGTWSARKVGGAWRGSWTARINRGRTFSGTWTAKTNAGPSAGFAALLDAAVAKMVTGAWEASGGQSGGWSIRTNVGR